MQKLAKRKKRRLTLPRLSCKEKAASWGVPITKTTQAGRKVFLKCAASLLDYPGIAWAELYWAMRVVQHRRERAALLRLAETEQERRRQGV